jgi:renalase
MDNKQKKISSFLVIGGGITGLLIARSLADSGFSVRVLDKGRGYGGRLATRRAMPARFDHGAQYFTVRDPRFQTWVDQWKAAGVIREWFDRYEGTSTDAEGHPRYVGVHGMSDIAKWLAVGVNVQRATRVLALSRKREVWNIHTDTDYDYQTETLILTCPVPQALSLLDSAEIDYDNGSGESLRAVCYEKGLALMGRLDGSSGLPGFGGIKVADGGPLAWIADNEMKGISEVPAITLHSTAAFAETHWETEDAIRGRLMVDAATPYLQSKFSEFSCHRWAFTKPLVTFGAPYFCNQTLGLLMAGDGFGGPRIEGAALSAIETIQYLFEAICTPHWSFH